MATPKAAVTARCTCGAICTTPSNGGLRGSTCWTDSGKGVLRTGGNTVAHHSSGAAYILWRQITDGALPKGVSLSQPAPHAHFVTTKTEVRKGKTPTPEQIL